MSNTDDYRFQSHKLLLELDSATTSLMMLVSARQIEGAPWIDATNRQRLAYEAWAAFLCVPKIDPMPILDGRAAGSYGSTAD
ncbi:hypothetical protein H8F22_10990 [Pseudomonas sp. P154a]|jgi:hypothetical protein|uniref:hypothetical protein n=1 Tax=Pseudomonas mucoides TaxID=2730424 RepID=UPI0018927F2C|nr:hypothetical protein [Pseudomonas mucoides]MBF6039397.1 hypothetical protein [Pseudomonas mucoides]